MVTTEESIEVIKASLPPATDPLTFLSILETQISPEILPTLNEILQDVKLTQSIGWDLVHLILPLPGAEECLTTIARLGNPREVVLKVTEAFQLIELDSWEDIYGVATDEEKSTAESTPAGKFGLLLRLLAILHPRIKTKYPSRFLSTSLTAVLSSFRPSNQATLSVISFVHTISGKKRPPLPGRKSSLNIPTPTNVEAQSAPDPEAQAEDPNEAAIQNKLLQSFVSHILEEYVNANSLEWASRLQESFDPKKVVTGKQSLGESFKKDPVLVTRDTIAGQLLALLRDLGLADHGVIFDAIYKEESAPSEEDPESNYPSSPEDIPLSRGGSLFILTSQIFSSVLFGSQTSLPSLTIFPDHAKLVKHFIGIGGSELIGSEASGVVDAILAIGLWLEHDNKFVAGPLEDEDFLLLLQSLSLLSANNPSPTFRYSAHVLTSSILHAHPTDRLRLTFISDTLEHCPYEALKASAIAWLKEEIITAKERGSNNIFSSTLALAAAQPYLFPDTSALDDADSEEIIQELCQLFPFHMAAINFIIFVVGKPFAQVVPPGMTTVVEEIYLGPLRQAHEKALTALEAGTEPELGRDASETKLELQLLEERIIIASAKINES